MNEGKVKSILKIDYKPSEEIYHVQFHIDRCYKKISAEYNQKYVEDKVKTLRKRINDKKSKSLHPIFISSRLRKENIEDEKFIDMNIIAKDLLNDGLEKDSFLIFLFIQAGINTTRAQFKNELDYYQSLKKKTVLVKTI